MNTGRHLVNSLTPFVVTLIFVCHGTTPAMSQTIVGVGKIPQVTTSAHAGFMASEIDYESDGDDVDLERSIIATGLDWGVAPDFRIFGQLGWSIDSEANYLKKDGAGYVLGGGLAAKVMSKGQTVVEGYGLVIHTKDEFEYQVAGQDVDVDISVTNFHVGGVVTQTLSSNLGLYGAAGIVLFSDGSIETSSPGGNTSDKDIEREDRLVLRLGATLSSGAFGFRPELALFGERTVTLAGFYIL